MIGIPIIFINSASTVMMCCLLWATYRMRYKQAAAELFIVSLFMVLWSVGSFAEMISRTFEMKVFWRNFTQIGVFMTPVATLMFILSFTDYLRRYGRRIKLFSYLYQTVAVLLILTDTLHHAARKSVSLASNGVHQVVVVVPTTLGSILVAGNFVFMVASLILISIAAWGSLKSARKQVYSVLLGIVVTVAYAFIKVSNAQFLQLAPISGIFALSGFLMLLGINRYDLLKLSPLAYEQAFRFLGDGIVVSTQQGRVIDANPAALSMFATNLEGIESVLKLSSSRWGELVLAAEQSFFSLQYAERFFHADIYPITNKRMQLVGSVTLIKDITMLEKQRVLLTERAERDGLTGLYNRQTFIEHVEQALAKDHMIAHLLYFDIDHFKTINDTFGHRAGDLVLSELGALLATWLSFESIVGRFGGEEFAVFSTSMEASQAHSRAEELRQRVQEHHFEYEGRVLHITVSMGLASAQVSSFDVLYRLADSLLYQAKKEGRNRLCSGQERGQSVQ